MPKIRMTLTALTIAAVSFSLMACAGKSPGDDGATTSKAAPGENVTPIAAGTALPAGYKVDAARTMIFGTNETWTGRLSYTTNSTADEVFDFLHKEMPNFGWSEMTSMRSDPSIFTFTSQATGRTATITIARAAKLASTRVDMVVSPNSAGVKR